MNDLELNPFHLVEFIKRGRKVERSLDSVPLKWLRYDKLKNKCFVKFMCPPYNDKTNKVLYTLIENEIEPPDHWQEYPVKLLGHASWFKMFLCTPSHLIWKAKELNLHIGSKIK